jgi:hypothetical protein
MTSLGKEKNEGERETERAKEKNWMEEENNCRLKRLM